MQHPHKHTCNICVKHMQHPNKHTYNVSLKKQIKHLEQTFLTYVYSHYNICNIPIYFCNILIKHLYHISETFEKYACNMRWLGGFNSPVYTPKRMRRPHIPADRRGG
jgi:hypothetical protein